MVRTPLRDCLRKRIKKTYIEKKYYLKHKKKILAQNRLYYKCNKVKIRITQDKWNKENIIKRRFYANAITMRRKLFVLQKYSQAIPSCACCGELEIKFLSIDHINGGGNKHRKKIGGGSGFYLWLKNHKFPKGYQVLCLNCNFAKGLYGVCPHKALIT